MPFRLWTDISIDYIGPLPDSVYYRRICNHILIVVDRFTKIRHFVLVSDTSAATLPDAFVSKIYRLYGMSAFIVSNCRTQFVSTFWKELSRRLDITLKHSSAVYPETDGQTEIVNVALKQYLRTYCGFYQEDWA